MAHIGYTMMTEQAGPRELVDHVVRAEEAGFDFSVTSDHYFPWLRSQGHAPYAWSVLGAAAQATSRIPLMTYVTCPTFRYHPAVVAQKAATLQLLSEGRFRLGSRLGREPQRARGGRRLAGRRRAARDAGGGGGDHPRAVRRRPREPPRHPLRRGVGASCGTCRTSAPPIGIAVSGDQSCALAGRAGRPRDRHRARRRSCWRPSTGTAARASRAWASSRCATTPTATRRSERAHDQFRWFGSGWKVNSELPHPDSFAAATQFVTPEDVAGVDPVRRRPGRLRGRPYARTWRPGSPRSPWSRSAASPSTPSSTGRRRPCCPRCARRWAIADRPRGRRGLYVRPAGGHS